jgi:hypothetical protein
VVAAAFLTIQGPRALIPPRSRLIKHDRTFQGLGDISLPQQGLVKVDESFD